YQLRTIRTNYKQNSLVCGMNVISRLASRHRTAIRVCDRPRSETPPVTDHNHDQYLRTAALRHGSRNITQVSRQMIHNRLHRFDLNTRRPFQVTPRHCCKHRQQAQDHVTWTMQYWSIPLYWSLANISAI
uniref:Transposase Tc1-like domain-containing protein n=1 Tax=Oryzias melastigma TaxID=30732 RepID=A0A3B3BTS6_ORYME